MPAQVRPLVGSGLEQDLEDARPGGLKNPHSVLTINLAETGPTKAADERVIAFFRERTSA